MADVLLTGTTRLKRSSNLKSSARRVVTAGGASILMGASPWIIPAMRQITVIDFRESINRKRLLTRDELLDRHFEIRELYLSIVDDLLHPSRPVLHNTDGDLLELTTLTYELDLAPAEAVERLTPLATLDDELHIADELLDASGALLGATLTWLRPGNRQHKSWDNTLGRFAVKGPQLVVDVNSAQRRRKAEKEIAKRLGAGARLVNTSIADVGEALAAVAHPPADDDAPPDLREVEAELAARHWNAWFDEKIPALGNKTPRQAARNAKGRERLDALLAHYEEQTQTSGGGPFAPDVAGLRRKLGLA